jgi:hypothetical protein
MRGVGNNVALGCLIDEWRELYNGLSEHPTSVILIGGDVVDIEHIYKQTVESLALP